MSTTLTRPCPYCGEEIRTIAVRCKHCHMMVDGSGKEAAFSGGVGSTAGPEYGPHSASADAARTDAYRLPANPVVGAGRYVLKRLLGKGGMGEVFLAEHTYTAQHVALKAVWPNLMESESSRKRFLLEGRLLAQLKHNNIVGLSDFFEEDGRFFLAMEYVQGETLAAHLHGALGRGEPLPLADIRRILGGVLRGVAHAHDQVPCVVHRDIKPANVMLAKDGRVVLMDFGIAKVADGEKNTRTAGVVGTYEYMSPEQVSGEGVTPATDVYSIGILAFELLTGVVPFPQRDASGFDAMEGHKTKNPPPVHQSRSDCPLELSAWVDKALSKSPTRRHQNASEMLAALEKVGELPSASEWGSRTGSAQRSGARSDAGVPRTSPTSLRSVRWLGGGMVVALLVGALVFSLSGPEKREIPSPERSIPDKSAGSAEAQLVQTMPVEAAVPEAARGALPGPAPLEEVEDSDAKHDEAATVQAKREEAERGAQAEREAEAQEAKEAERARKDEEAQENERRRQLEEEAEQRSRAKMAAESRRRAAWKSAYSAISPGCFVMGSPAGEKGRFDIEQQHEVCVSSGYYIKKTEVTQSEWYEVMGTHPSYNDSCGGNCPVERVSWWDALAFCNELSDRESLTQCYTLSGCSGTIGLGCEEGVDACEGGFRCSGVAFRGLDCEGYRLPTEAEWEYAARAGTEGSRYGPLDQIAWYESNCGGGNNEVRQKKSNSIGIYDMLGNSWEWCWDWYDKTYYDYSPARDPLGPGSGRMRSIRGGGWHSHPKWVRAAARGSAPPAKRLWDVTVRPVRSR